MTSVKLINHSSSTADWNYSNISSDLETIGVSSLITAIGAVMASVISIFCISSYKQSDETDR